MPATDMIFRTGHSACWNRFCRGGVARDNRRFLDAVLWVLHTGVPWWDLPPDYGGRIPTDAAAAGVTREYGSVCQNNSSMSWTTHG